MKSFAKSIISIAVSVAAVASVSGLYRGHLLAAVRPSFSENAPVKDTLVIDTRSLGAEIYGYADVTPLEIRIFDDKVVSVKALPNKETPGFFRRVENSEIFTRPVGLSVDEALALELDAVSGATYSSKAVIENLRLGLAAAKNKK